jgi:hypothetical protein
MGNAHEARLKLDPAGTPRTGMRLSARRHAASTGPHRRAALMAIDLIVNVFALSGPYFCRAPPFRA